MKPAAPPFPKRAQSAALHLLILAAILTAVYFILGWWFTPLMVAILVAAILLPLAFPHRYEDLISALSWLAIAALAWFYFGAQPSPSSPASSASSPSSPPSRAEVHLLPSAPHGRL